MRQPCFVESMEDVEIKLALKWKLKAGPFQNKEIRDVAQRLKNNMTRVSMSTVLLPWMVGKATMYQDAATKVMLAATPQERDHPDFIKNSQDKIHAITDGLEKECHANVKRGREMDEHAYNTIKCLLAWYGQPEEDGSRNHLRLGFDSFFQSALIGAWTAIEIAIEDLYDVSVKLVGHRNTEVRDAGSRIVDLVQALRRQPPIEKNQIRGRSGKSKNFRSLLGIRVAYGCWFNDQSKEIDFALSSLDLDALALLRNVIVHSAALPDPDFLKQSTGIPKLKQWIDPGLSQIFINGAHVGCVINSALKPISALAVAVDKWISKKLTP